jgi:hypothetical protein
MKKSIVVQGEYAKNLYKKSTIDKILNDYISILTAIVDNPQIPISELELKSLDGYAKPSLEKLEEIEFGI